MAGNDDSHSRIEGVLDISGRHHGNDAITSKNCEEKAIRYESERVTKRARSASDCESLGRSKPKDEKKDLLNNRVIGVHVCLCLCVCVCVCVWVRVGAHVINFVVVIDCHDSIALAANNREVLLIRIGSTTSGLPLGPLLLALLLAEHQGLASVDDAVVYKHGSVLIRVRFVPADFAEVGGSNSDSRTGQG